MSRRILAVVDDMFFASKIRATAEAVGVEVGFLRSTEALLRRARETKPDLILVDLHNQRLNPVELGVELKSDDSLNEIPLLGFFSHIDTELQRSALGAGYNKVLPRSLFSRDLAGILTGEIK